MNVLLVPNLMANSHPAGGIREEECFLCIYESCTDLWTLLTRETRNRAGYVESWIRYWIRMTPLQRTGSGFWPGP